MMNPSESETPDTDPSVALVQKGDTRAFDTLYTRYAPRVLGFLLRLTGNPAEAEDLLQETFVAGYTGCRSYAGQSRPLAWLLGIAARRWRDKRRSARPDTAPLPESLPYAANVEQQVIARMMLDNALAQLETPYRETLLLIAAQGLSYREAAAVTGEPLGTIKWRFHEATRQMRILLQNEELAAIPRLTSQECPPHSRVHLGESRPVRDGAVLCEPKTLKPR